MNKWPKVIEIIEWWLWTKSVSLALYTFSLARCKIVDTRKMSNVELLNTLCHVRIALQFCRRKMSKIQSELMRISVNAKFFWIHIYSCGKLNHAHAWNTDTHKFPIHIHTCLHLYNVHNTIIICTRSRIGWNGNLSMARITDITSCIIYSVSNICMIIMQKNVFLCLFIPIPLSSLTYSLQNITQNLWARPCITLLLLI